MDFREFIAKEYSGGLNGMIENLTGQGEDIDIEEILPTLKSMFKEYFMDVGNPFRFVVVLDSIIHATRFRDIMKKHEDDEIDFTQKLIDQVVDEARQSKKIPREGLVVSLMGSTHGLTFEQFYNNAQVATQQVKKGLIEPYTQVVKLQKSLGAVCFCEKLTMIIKKPTTLKYLKSTGQFHNLNGPAVEFCDGQQMHYVRSVRIPIQFTKKAPSLKELMAVSNQDTRSAILSYWQTPIMSEITAKSDRIAVQSFDGIQDMYELYSYNSPLTESGINPLFLKMINPSTGQFHITGIAPDCRDIQIPGEKLSLIDKSLIWRNQLTQFPCQLTKIRGKATLTYSQHGENIINSEEVLDSRETLYIYPVQLA
jgi:hypothetical protein